MLPSKGFFKKNDCPFYEKGLCVRPHCHFRHKKKVLNDESGFGETLEEANEEAEEADRDLIKLFADCENVSESDKKPSSSRSETNNVEDHSSHDTLFAKLVNQTNTYEKINRHIPCAYTPTPQSRNAVPKNKTVSAGTGFANSEKSLELITKARTLLQNYCAENIKKFENKVVGSSDKKSDININDNNSNLKNDNEKNVLSLVGASSDVKLCTKDEGSKANYVPSKDSAATAGGQCVSNNGESHSSSKSIPNKKNSGEKANDSITKDEASKVIDHKCTRDEDMTKTNCDESVDSFTKLTNRETCEVTAGENASPDEEGCSPDDVISQLDFISSEIEMMKKFLNDDDEDGKDEAAALDEKCTEVNEKEEKLKGEEKIKESSHSDHHQHHHHKSSSRHKSRNSDSHASSRSKHRRHSSSRHSRHSSSSDRHQSSSSRGHFSSRHRTSSTHHSSSSRHEKHSKKSDRELDRKQHSKSHKDHDSSNKNKNAENHIRSSSSVVKDEEDDDEEDLDNNRDSGMECIVISDDDEKTVSKSRKRKNSSSEDLINTKYISLANDDEDDPALIEKECLEIFNSYDKSKGPSCPQEVNMSLVEYENSVQGKKRTAHSTSVLADHSALRHKTYTKPHFVKSAQDVMLDRYKAAEKVRESQPQVSQTNAPSILGLNRPSVRIAAVSNIQQMLLAKKAIQDKISKGLKVNERTTIAQTVPQGGSRVAHTPNVSDLKEKPIISDGSKQVPRVKRQTYLEKLLIETNQIYPTKTESAEEALKLEQEIFRLHSGSFPAYHTAFVSLLMKTRRRVASVRGEVTTTTGPKTKVSHFDILSGGKKNFSVIKTKKVELCMLTDKQIYEELFRCRLTPEQLKENGFPMSCDRPGYATCSLNYELKYNEKYQFIKKISGNRRYCIRCAKQYEVDPVSLRQYKEGPETCSYHPGRKKSGGRNCERIYNCCNSSSTEGCATHVRHVTDCNDYENYPNCVKTLAKDDETNPGVFALDCEMVYTRLGSELARVTVVNLKKEIVYDTLVKPKSPVECYNTFYSGIEEKMMDGVETTLKDVQAVLLSMFSNKTILIGHSLDSDLRALHLIHDTVVDTSVVYKNEKFHPYKYSLKELCATKISKIIQDNVGGHDSSEDAIAALELMLQYVKEEIAKYDSLESYEAERGK